MRVGLIADIHGNTVALDTVLADASQRELDLIVCLGDIAANGPDPQGAVERIAALDCPVVMGNTDADLINPPDWWHDPAAVGVPGTAQSVAEIGLWCVDQLTETHRAFLAELPAAVDLDLADSDASRLLAFHGSPRAADDTITADTPTSELTGMLVGADHAVLVGGHTHVPMVRRYKTQTIINPGSVGLPFASYGHVGEVTVLNHAAYGVVTSTGTELSIDLHQVPVDRDRLSHQVEISGMPGASWWLGLRS